VFASEVVRREPARVEIRFRGVDSPLMPPVPGVIRMRSVDGSYRLDALDAARTRVEYQLEMDMGGWVPSLVTDYVSDQMPVHTLLGLKQQVKRVAAERSGTPESAVAGGVQRWREREAAKLAR
jgi:hypothetical protein